MVRDARNGPKRAASRGARPAPYFLHNVSAPPGDASLSHDIRTCYLSVNRLSAGEQ